MNGGIPNDKGNAQHVNTICAPMYPLTLLRYEAVADFYSEEPTQVNVRKAKGEDYVSYEQVFRLRLLVPHKGLYSWMLYSEKRQWNSFTEIDGLVIRSVHWDREYDEKRVRTGGVSGQKELLKQWPTLDIDNTFFTPNVILRQARNVNNSENELRKCLEDLERELQSIDSILEERIPACRREISGHSPTWNFFEIMRQFDYGMIHLSWDASMENSQIESHSLFASELLKKIESLISGSIDQMDMDYSIPPETYKAVIDGKLE